MKRNNFTTKPEELRVFLILYNWPTFKASTFLFVFVFNSKDNANASQTPIDVYKRN